MKDSSDFAVIVLWHCALYVHCWLLTAHSVLSALIRTTLGAFISPPLLGGGLRVETDILETCFLCFDLPI